jgi:hypothetical protein
MENVGKLLNVEARTFIFSFPPVNKNSIAIVSVNYKWKSECHKLNHVRVNLNLDIFPSWGSCNSNSSSNGLKSKSSLSSVTSLKEDGFHYK